MPNYWTPAAPLWDAPVYKLNNFQYQHWTKKIHNSKDTQVLQLHTLIRINYAN